MIKILFVCHGNICRSPMAKFVMKDIVDKAGLQGAFVIDSAATSREELGNPVYPPAAKMLKMHGIDCSGHYARQVKQPDFEYYDYLICMDLNNVRNLKRIGGERFADKISLLMDYTDRGGEVADPWYTGDFESTWMDVTEGCRGLFRKLTGAPEVDL